MPRRHYSRFARTVVAALVMLLAAFPVLGHAAETEAEPVRLQLEVSINGQPTGLVADFVDLGDGRLASRAGELNELRIKTAPDRKPDDIIALDSLKGVSYVYDEQKQTLALQADDSSRIADKHDARGSIDKTRISPSGYGAVLNYTLFGSYGGEDTFSSFRSNNFSGVNATLDGRVITPNGVFNQTAIVGMTLAEETETLRLDTTYTFSHDKTLSRWRAGDFISGGTNWSRPVRMAGVQWQRAFSMRPDLVRSPLPSISGSAAVPSSVDVYVNGIKSFTKDVAAGPYQIDNIPTVTGSGVAQVVTRDASGRETVQAVSFYNSPQLLKPGLSDFSFEAGFTRSQYGVESNDYDETLVGAVTLRRGISDWLTLEGHAEGGGDLVNAGAGAVVNVKNRALVTAAASASSSSKGTGIQLYGGFETKLGPITINGRAQHALDTYDDLASMTARNNPVVPLGGGLGLPGIASGLFSYAPPRAIDSLTVSAPLTFDKSTVSATYLRYANDSSGVTELVTATYARPLMKNTNLQATGFVDINDTASAGLYVGVSMALDGGVSTTAGISARSDSFGANVSASKPVGQEPGDWGWRINDLEGETKYRTASVGYRSEAARIEAGLVQEAKNTIATASVDGAVSLIGGNVYTSGRIDDSFAVVDTHLPDVKVQRDNVVVGKTNADGKILIPSLSAYHKNKISIDPMDLPLNAEPETTYEYVRPAFKSGVHVDFKVKKATPSAIVVLKDASGAFVQPGSEITVDGSDEVYVVGYDGQAFIKDLKAVNTIHVTSDKGTCTTQFAFKPTSEVQPMIGPEICQ
jgi:outer membrane usher protein